MTRIWTWCHINFHCLQPAPLTPSSAPRPVATVFGSIAQYPDNKEAEIREQGWSKLYDMLFTKPALMESIGHSPATGASPHIPARVVGVLKADSAFTLVCANL